MERYEGPKKKYKDPTIRRKYCKYNIYRMYLSLELESGNHRGQGSRELIRAKKSLEYFNQPTRCDSAYEYKLYQASCLTKSEVRYLSTVPPSYGIEPSPSTDPPREQESRGETHPTREIRKYTPGDVKTQPGTQKRDIIPLLRDITPRSDTSNLLQQGLCARSPKHMSDVEYKAGEVEIPRRAGQGRNFDAVSKASEIRNGGGPG